MTDRIVWLDPDPHAGTRKLLPWFVSGRLDEAERAEVEAHLAMCAACRSELEFEQVLQAALRTGVDSPGDVDAGWARMLARVEADARHVEPPTRRSLPWFLGGGVPARAWAVPGLLSIALLLALAVTLGPSLHRGDDYRALAAPADAGATAVVRFRPGATEAQMRQSLAASGARVVDGPTVTDAWVVRLPRDRYAAALATLRGQPTVLLVEALEGAGSP